MSLENEIYQLYSSSHDNKGLIERAQIYLKADDKTEKSLRNAFINCAAALMSDRELMFNSKHIVLQLVELAAKLCQIRPDEHEYLQQLSAYLTLSLTKYSAHLDYQLIPLALFTTNSSKALSSGAVTSKQLTINIQSVNKSVSSSNSNISTVVKNITQQSSTNNVIQQTATNNVIQQPLSNKVIQQTVQQASQLSSSTSSTQQATPKDPSPQLAVNIKPAKKPLESWTVTDSLSPTTKHTLH